MAKIIIILFILFSLCCNKENEPQGGLNAEEPTILTYFVKAGDTISCAELMNEYDEMLRQPKEPQTFGEFLGESSKTCDDKYCLEIKTRLENEFNIRYKMLKNDPQYSVNVDTNGGKCYSEETWYEKRFGTTISDFERLTTHIIFYIGGDGALEFAHSESHRYSLSHFSLIKTATGAVARYHRNEFIEPIEMKLDINEWMDFIRILYRSCVSKWEREYGHFKPHYYDVVDFQRNTQQWKLERFSLNKKESDEYYGFPPHPPCWYTLRDAIYTIKNKMYRDAMVKMESQLEIDYQKKFGESITDLELSTVHIYYYHFRGLKDSGPRHFLATKTTTGGFVECQSSNGDWFVANLDINEWLDFIRFLHKNMNVWREWLDTTDSGFRSGVNASEVKKWYIDISPLRPEPPYDSIRPLDRWAIVYAGYFIQRTSCDRLMEQPFAKDFINLMLNIEEKVKMKDKQRQIDGKTDQAQKR